MSHRSVVQRKKTAEAPQQTVTRGPEAPASEPVAASTVPFNIGEIPIEAPQTYVLGQRGDRLEREADSAAQRVLSPRRAEPMQLSPASAPASVMQTDASDPARTDAAENTTFSGIDDVSRSDGQSLDSGSRALMERRLGHDFGNVRVHTDERAASSARSLDALAYTMGNDVVFGAGKYAPQTDEGQYLIAHELTHVVQQEASASAAGPVQLVQRASEVIPKVGWGTVPEFTDDSKMTFNPFARLTLGGGAFLDNWFPGTGAGVREEQFTLPKGTTEGSLMIQVTASWFKDDITSNLDGEALYTAKTPFTVTTEGVIQWGTLLPNADNKGVGAQLVLPVPATATGDTMTVSPTLNGVGSVGDTSTSTVQVAPGGVGGSKTEGRTLTSPGGASANRTYSIKLKTIPEPAEVTSHTFSAHFAVNSDVVEDGTEARIAKWYQTELPQETRKSVDDGITEVLITGHASTTNTISYNRDLSKRRALKVEEILWSYANSKAKMVHGAPSFTDAPQYNKAAGKVDTVEEDPNERRVDVLVTYVKKPASTAPTGAAAAKP